MKTVFTIVSLTPEAAARIAAWVYDAPYTIYSLVDDWETREALMREDYVQALEGDVLAGYFCFGDTARIPTLEADVYAQAAVDIGLGMRPDLCGCGRGPEFLRAGMDFARDRRMGAGRIAPLRLTVAEFNARAIKVYERAGFRRVRRVTHNLSRQPFWVMVCGGA